MLTGPVTWGQLDEEVATCARRCRGEALSSEVAQHVALKPSESAASWGPWTADGLSGWRKSLFSATRPQSRRAAAG